MLYYDIVYLLTQPILLQKEVDPRFVMFMLDLDSNESC